ncbi:hypothetical protein FRC10_004326 [Ceratobasidium sp. 414]|nr:hypothetical protein FRC10_004326 [Ceratobasidium sp. 414]
MSLQADTNTVPGAPQFNAENFNRDVCDAISEYKGNPGVFVSPSELSFDDLSTLLGIIVSTCLGSPGPDRQACAAHLGTHRSLVDRLFDAYRDKSFADLLSDRLKSAFEKAYVGETHKVFIAALDAERRSYSDLSAPHRPYNFAISVIQSSGMGKSRMVEEAGNIMFTIPINIRENLPPGIKTYPPSDGVFRQYFEDRKSRTDEQQQADYAVLLRVLFEHATKLVEEQFQGHTGEDLALRFANYLKQGRDEATVGENRRQFLDNVAHEAARVSSKLFSLSATIEALEQLRAGSEMGETLESLATSLQASCRRLINVIHPERPADANACFVYFDEAHTLTPPVEIPASRRKNVYPAIQPGMPADKNPNRTQYQNLGLVLSTLVKEPIAFIFISTNSRLETFASTAANHPSAGGVDGSEQIPPFTELPFDVFESKTMPLTLDNLCTTEAIVGLGRAMWKTQHEIYPNGNIIRFAIDKLSACGLREHKFDSTLAALGIRIGITFQETNPDGHAAQSRLVETHMRVVYSIPRHREYMHTGSPSEPILAEAAAYYLKLDNSTAQLYDRDSTAQLGPKNLSIACQEGLLEWEKGRELYGRLLVTTAHDIAVRDYFATTDRPPFDQPFYHHPIPLLGFLRALFHSDYHDLVLGALPISNSDGGDTLQQAFSDSFVFFSHFAPAGDLEMLSAFGLSTALVRGAAIQAKACQTSIDAVIPVHMGPRTAPISEKTTSAINLQFRNRTKALDCWVDRSILGSNKAKPAISIIFEFGCPEPGVIVDRRLHPASGKRETEPGWDDHHYQIVAYGHSPTVFAAVAPDSEAQINNILGAPTYMDSFPRRDNEGSRNALLNLLPEFSGARERAKYAGLSGQDEEPSAEPPPAQAVEMEGAVHNAASSSTAPAPKPKKKKRKGRA